MRGEGGGSGDSPHLDDTRDDEEVYEHAVDKHETAGDVPITVERPRGVGGEGADRREGGHDLEDDELEHLAHLFLGN